MENRAKSAWNAEECKVAEEDGEGEVEGREKAGEKRGHRELGTVICKEAGVCFGRWQQSAAVRDNPPVIKTINPSAD